MTAPYHPRITQWRDEKVIWIDSSNLDASLMSFKAGDASFVGISPYNGFKGTDISFLKSIPDLTGLVMPYPEGFSLDPVCGLSKLRLLVLGKERSAFDFSTFADLTELSTDWKSSDVLPDSHSGLQRLSLWGFNSKSRDLRGLPAYRHLFSLKLVQGSLETLDDIEKYQSLREAEFAYLRRLKMVRAIGTCGVETLEFDSCRNIEDFALLAKCERLKLLRYSHCGSLQSLSPLKNFKALENFRFVDTNILDGDLSPLLRLKSTGFMMKRHYSHTPKQVAIAIGDASYFEIEEARKNRVVIIS